MIQTFTRELPRRVTSTHYTIRSSKGDRVYNLRFNAQLKRWQCDCPDGRPSICDEQGHVVQFGNNNPNDKHIRRLREYIEACKDLQQSDLVSRTASLEAQGANFREVSIAQDLYIRKLADRVEHLEKSVTSLSECQDTHIQDTDAELHRLRNYCIQLSAFAKQQTESEKAQEIVPVRNDYGRIVAAKIGNITIQVSGKVSGNCSCGRTTARKQCEHIALVDQFLQSAELVK